jgi:putative ABC transport system substrate-binding protein
MDRPAFVVGAISSPAAETDRPWEIHLVTSMSRRALAIGVCAALFAPTSTRAQAVSGMRRMGYLAPGPSPLFTDHLIPALRERGWIVGRNLAVETHYTQGDPARAEALARELAQGRVDVIVTNFTGTAMAARRATADVPIVMLTSGFPVEGGLAKSLARPGGNVTGMAIYAGGGPLFGKFVELLRELVPSLRELGVLWGYAPPSYKLEQVAPAIDELHRAGKALKVNVRFWQTGRGSDLDSALAAAATAPLDALFVTSGVIHGLPEISAKIGAFALQRRLPVLTDGTTRGGVVLAYGAESKELAARTAYFVDRILKGAKPGELPIEQPTQYKLSVNLKTAKALGLTIPPAVLARADEVIE